MSMYRSIRGWEVHRYFLVESISIRINIHKHEDKREHEEKYKHEDKDYA